MRSTLSSGRVALVLSGLALLIALGGTAYAVNTVRSADIVDGAIRSQDIGTGQVASVDIANGGVGLLDNTAAGLGRVRRITARVHYENDVTTVPISWGGLGTITRDSAGRFTIQAGRDITECNYFVTPRTSGIIAAADEASTTAVNVYLDDHTGAPTDSDFDIVFFC